MTTRAVLSGLGVVAPTGVGARPYWRATIAGRNGIRPIGRPDAGRSPVMLAGEVTGFDAARWIDDGLRAETDRWTWFALAAAEMALADAMLRPADHPPFHLSVVTSSGSGGNESGQRETHALWARQPGETGAHQSIAWFHAAGAAQISIRHGLTGGCGVVAADGAGGLDALKHAWRLLRRGGKAVIVGGTEAPLSPFALACQSTLPTVHRGTDPERAYLPFSPHASGFVPGEGGALMVLEEKAHAAERGVRGYAELLGHAATHDAHHHTAPAADGVQLARAVTTALEQAGRAPGDVDVVFADGAGDPAGDAAEAAALRRVFGDRLAEIPVTVPKAGVGRLTSGAGALDAVTAALALRTGVVPPTRGGDARAARERYGVRLVTRWTRPERLTTAVVLARGTGGFNSAVVLGSLDADSSY
ncbi:beta-ketoacyl synthase N-terminal-like domain-containing protein [Actinacidiphila glaucinigra]|uniref:beta-ketoacyl synthase N-terminal-like domain-containing protein n=1 Tax=Actinacidiphila glaucinigra TaxID=235986 RepID=UPI00378E4E30